VGAYFIDGRGRHLHINHSYTKYSYILFFGKKVTLSPVRVMNLRGFLAKFSDSDN
jgi:hypothetical protein